jgi:hypothetical protein
VRAGRCRQTETSTPAQAWHYVARRRVHATIYATWCHAAANNSLITAPPLCRFVLRRLANRANRNESLRRRHGTPVAACTIKSHVLIERPPNRRDCLFCLKRTTISDAYIIVAASLINIKDLSCHRSPHAQYQSYRLLVTEVSQTRRSSLCEMPPYTGVLISRRSRREKSKFDRRMCIANMLALSSRSHAM